MENLLAHCYRSHLAAYLSFVLISLVFSNRSNAFEVSSMDGGASVVLYSENKVEMLSWYSAIKDRVVMLLEQSVSFQLSSYNYTDLQQMMAKSL